jgi:hypothetical protein
MFAQIPLFSGWVGRLFVGAALDVSHQVIKDEIDKVHDDISNAIVPILATVPEGPDKQKMMTEIVAVSKAAAVYYAEAYINTYILPMPPSHVKN